jgi:predicted oxidoreductase
LDIRLQALSAVHHTLLAKGDGTFVLALWQEVQEWNPLQQRAMRVVPLPVTIWLDSRPHGLTRTIFGPDGVPASHSLPTSAHFSLSIDGGVTLVDIAP